MIDSNVYDTSAWSWTDPQKDKPWTAPSGANFIDEATWNAWGGGR